MEVLSKGKVPMSRALYSGVEWKHLRKIFSEGKQNDLDRLAKDSVARKRRFVAGQKTDRDKAVEELAEAGQDWSAEFAGWETDPKIVVNEWTAFEMNRNRRFYGLPSDKSRWPAPREFVSLWFARGYVVARLRDIFGDGRKATDGGDLYDNMYFEERPPRVPRSLGHPLRAAPAPRARRIRAEPFNAARPHQGIGQRMSADFDAERGRELRTWVTMPRRRVGLELARMRRTNFA
jgi:hypothetical protein